MQEGTITLTVTKQMSELDLESIETIMMETVIKNINNNHITDHFGASTQKRLKLDCSLQNKAVEKVEIGRNHQLDTLARKRGITSLERRMKQDFGVDQLVRGAFRSHFKSQSRMNTQNMMNSPLVLKNLHRRDSYPANGGYYSNKERRLGNDLSRHKGNIESYVQKSMETIEVDGFEKEFMFRRDKIEESQGFNSQRKVQGGKGEIKLDGDGALTEMGTPSQKESISEISTIQSLSNQYRTKIRSIGTAARTYSSIMEDQGRDQVRQCGDDYTPPRSSTQQTTLEANYEITNASTNTSTNPQCCYFIYRPALLEYIFQECYQLRVSRQVTSMAVKLIDQYYTQQLVNGVPNKSKNYRQYDSSQFDSLLYAALVVCSKLVDQQPLTILQIEKSRNVDGCTIQQQQLRILQWKQWRFTGLCEGYVQIVEALLYQLGQQNGANNVCLDCQEIQIEVSEPTQPTNHLFLNKCQHSYTQYCQLYYFVEQLVIQGLEIGPNLVMEIICFMNNAAKSFKNNKVEPSMELTNKIIPNHFNLIQTLKQAYKKFTLYMQPIIQQSFIEVSQNKITWWIMRSMQLEHRNHHSELQENYIQMVEFKG